MQRLGSRHMQSAVRRFSVEATSPATARLARLASWPNRGRRRTVGQLQQPASHASRRQLGTRANDDDDDGEDGGTYSEADHEHAVISTFDLFSIGLGPSSSHTVGPMRAGNIFVTDLAEAGLLPRVDRLGVSLYGSLALTGEGHMTPSALLLGLEGADVETVDPAYVPARFARIKRDGRLLLAAPGDHGEAREIAFDYDKHFIWRWGQKLPLHSNGMRLSVYDEAGTMLATNDLFSVGGGFVVNGAMSISSSSSWPADGSIEDTSAHPVDLAENLFYKEIHRSDAAGDRKHGAEIRPADDDENKLAVVETGDGQRCGPVSSRREESSPASNHPRYPFHDARSLLALCHKHNLTIAQLVYENEKSLGYTDEQILEKLFRIWEVMDNSILQGVQAAEGSVLPGSLKLTRRAPALYRRLTRGLYSESASSSHDIAEGSGDSQTRVTGPSSTTSLMKPTTASERLASIRTKRHLQRMHGSLYHPIPPSPARRTNLPALDYLTAYAIAVNETNAAGGRIVTAPTNGAAGIIPAVLKYTTEFISDDPDQDVATFLLTAAAIGMLYKRGATISAAEGGCMAEVGVACSMAAAAFAACMGGPPETVEQAAEIGIEHNLGLTCDPIGGLVQAPCIERNALGAVKAVASANLALQSKHGAMKVRLDDAIRAMRLTAKGMRNEFKETSLSGLATSVPLNIPVSVPDC